MLDSSRPFRCYRLNVFPYPAHTVAMLTCTDWRGRTESNRRVNTWDLTIHSADLAAVSEHDALQMILRDVLDRLDPPEGATWAEPPEPPEGGYGGQHVTFDQIPLPLD